ncbi:uncharacterized protein LOC115696272 [Cannabis sativa]|uniref:uncharacterized protein LOC115696272 n=1 Tax=Cannabis sativa TaxID=3483 RepID=UPI0029C9D02B|nr:uncharacterized protein LOC115696272 [Cannabis sativa]
MSSMQIIFQAKPRSSSSLYGVCSPSTIPPARSTALSWNLSENKTKTRPLIVVGDVSADGTASLIAGAAAVALLGTAFPILFSRKDTYEKCPECDGAVFVQKSRVTIQANAARKDETQIFCCNGLGKLSRLIKVKCPFFQLSLSFYSNIHHKLRTLFLIYL